MVDTGFGAAAELTDVVASMTADQAVSLVRELCAHLAVNGAEFHGNIWPGSVRIEEDGQAVLGEGSDVPVAGRTAGQVEYLSPEFFWENEGNGASDVYSLGLMLYAGCNGGYLPFQPKGGALTDKDRSGALRKRMKGEAIPMPAGVSSELGEVLQKALAYEPEDRYPNPAALLAALSGTDEALPADASEEAEAAPVSPAPEAPAAEPAPETDAAPEKAAAAAGAAAAAVTAAAPAAKGGKGKKNKSKKNKSAGKNEPAKAEPAKEAPKAEEPKKPEPAKDTAAPAWVKAEEEKPAAPAPERKYTVQKDFEKTPKKKQKAESAAPASRTKKKKASPVIPLLCVAALAVIGGGVWFALTHKTPTVSPRQAVESSPMAEPVVVLPVESPDATEAPSPLDSDVHTGMIADLMTDAEAEAEAEPAAATSAPAAVGSPTIDGMDVTPASGDVYVTGSGVNLRQGPGTSYQVATTLSRGTKLALTGAVNGWSQVQYDGKEYYVSSSLISTENPLGAEEKTETAEAAPAATTAPASSGSKSSDGVTAGSGTLRVTSDVNIRSGPGTNYEKIGEAKEGATLTATGVVDGKWYRVEYNGKEGYVNRKLVSAGDFTVSSDKSGKLEVISDVNIRSGPGTSFDKIGEAKEGETLTMTGYTDSNWYQVSFNGKTGYVAGNLVDEID